MTDDVAFDNDRGQELAGLVDGTGDRGVALCSHFTGFKELAHLHRLARALADADVTALRFDYSDCIGESEGACEEMAVTHQVRDTLAALDVLEDRGAKRHGLFGHSLGGLTAIAAAAEGDVDALAVVAAPARPAWEGTFGSRAEQWKQQGYVTFDTWKQGEVRIPYGFYEDLKRYDAAELIADVDAPTLVVHLGDDELVDRDAAEAIHGAAPEPKELLVVDGADHLMSDRDDERRVVETVVAWMDDHL